MYQFQDSTYIFEKRADESFTCKNLKKTKTNKQTTGERENKIFGDSFSTNASKYTHVYICIRIYRDSGMKCFPMKINTNTHAHVEEKNSSE